MKHVCSLSLMYSYTLLMLLGFYCTHAKAFSFNPQHSVIPYQDLNHITFQSKNFFRHYSLSSSSSQIIRKQQTPPIFTATNFIIALNCFVFLITKGNPILGAFFPMFNGSPRLLNRLIKSNRAIRYGQYYRLVTSIFCHGGLLHLLFNNLSLYQLGPNVEFLHGPVGLVAFYLASGVMADYATFVLDMSPYSLGASGSVFGLIGALAVYFYRNKKILGKQSQSALENIKMNLVRNLLYGFASSGIDNGAHIAGFLSGALLSYIFGRNLEVSENRFFGRPKYVDRPIIPLGRLWKEFVTNLALKRNNQENKDISFTPKRPPSLNL